MALKLMCFGVICMSCSDSINASYHSTIKMSPFQCVFGSVPIEATWMKAADIAAPVALSDLDPDEVAELDVIPGVDCISKSLPRITRHGASRSLSATVAVLFASDYQIPSDASRHGPVSFRSLPARLKEAAATSFWEETAAVHTSTEAKLFAELASKDLAETLPLLANLLLCNIFIVQANGECSTAIPFNDKHQLSICVLQRTETVEAITFADTTGIPVAVEKVRLAHRVIIRVLDGTHTDALPSH